MTNRLENLETDVALLKRNAVHSAELLVDHSELLGRIQRSVNGLEQRFDGLERRFDGLERRFDGLERRFDGLEARFDGLQRSLEGRLDRLIALTTEERTAQYERLGDVERRLSKLEEER